MFTAVVFFFFSPLRGILPWTETDGELFSAHSSLPPCPTALLWLQQMGWLCFSSAMQLLVCVLLVMALLFSVQCIPLQVGHGGLAGISVLVNPIHCLKWSVNALSSLPNAELCLFSLVDHFVSMHQSTWLLESWEERTFHAEVKRNLKV